MTNQSRRQFLKGLAAIVSAAYIPKVFSDDKATSQPAKKYTIDNYIDAVIEIESNGNPQAKRYEQHINDTSYGLGQILTRTAKDLEKRHPELQRLGKTKEQIKQALYNPEINRTYTTALFKEGLDFYQDPFLAVSAYNSGHLTPRNAYCQEQLNELYQINLTTDGIIGLKSKEAVKRFQKEHDLEVDGIIGPQTYKKLQEVWTRKFPSKPNPKGIVPINKYTPNHVRKFRKALEN